MEVYFQNLKSEERKIGSAPTFKEAWHVISEFLLDHGFTTYYQRVWKEDYSSSRYIIDVGAHFEFFIIDSNGVDLLAIINGGNKDENKKE